MNSVRPRRRATTREMGRPLHIVHLFPCLYLGGAEQHALRLIQALSPKHSFSLIAPDGPGAPLFDNGGVPRRKFRRLELDVLSGFSSVRKALAAEAAERSIDIVHVHVESALLPFAHHVLPNVPRVYTSHGIVGAAALKYRLTAFATNRWADLSCLVSQHDLDRFVACGARPDKLRLVLSGVTIPPSSEAGRRAMAQRLDVDPDRHRVIGTLARLESEKGLDLLIRAVARMRTEYPEIRLVIAGTGSQEKRLRQLVDEVGCSENVSFAGFVREIGDFLGCLHVYAQPSRTEAFGLGVTEAMASALPAVVTRVGGLPEQVIDGDTGLLVPPEDVVALASALSRLLADPDLRAAMGRKAVIRHARNFSLDAMVRRMEGVYAEVLAGNSLQTRQNK